MQNVLSSLVQQPPGGWLAEARGVFLLRADGMPEPDRRLLSAVAKVVLLGDLGDLVSQLERPASWLYDDMMSRGPQSRRASTRRHTHYGPANRHGKRVRRFQRDGREYVVVLDGERETPLPWSNVLANPSFGTSEQLRFSVHLGWEQPREPVDPVRQRSVERSDGEAFYLRTIESGAVWGATPGPLPRRADAGRWVIRHGAGVTRYQHAVAGIEQELTVFVAGEDPVKLAVLTLTSTAGSHGASVCSATSSGVSDRRAPASAASSSRRWTT